MLHGSLREWLARLWATWRASRDDRELEEELRLHAQLAADEGRRPGPTAQAMEALRDQRGFTPLRDLGRDVRYALRLAAVNPAFSVTVILSLAAALALALTVLRVINGYLIRPLPYPQPDRLYSVRFRAPGEDQPRGLDRVDWSALDRVVEHRIAWDLDMFYLLGGALPESVAGAWISPGFVEGFGVRAQLGRLFQPADFSGSGPPPVVLSHRLWVDRFARDPAVVGRHLRAYVSDRPDEPETLIVVGVLAPDVWHVNRYTDILAPLRAPAYPYVVALRPGADAGPAADLITRQVRAALGLPDTWRARLTSMQAQYVEEMRPLLTAVAAAAGLVLLIACANVAVLLLLRGTRRRQEFAIRLALGASRARLARLLLFESGVLCAAALALGIAASNAAAHWLAPAVENHLGRRLPGGVSALAFDGTLAAAAAAGGLCMTLAFTITPLLTTWSAPLVAALGNGRVATAGRLTQRIRSALVGCEVAAALALLCGAALMIQSALSLLRIDLGFRTRGVLTSSVGLRQRAYPDPSSRAEFFERLLHRLQEPPVAASAALTDAWPLQPVAPRPVVSDDAARIEARAAVVSVTAGYFAALEIEFRDGRSFADHDRIGGDPVVVISQSLARRLWPDGRAVGRRLRMQPASAEDAHAPLDRSYLVVGVVEDVQQLDADDGQIRADRDQLDAYVPLMANPRLFAFLCARVPPRALPDSTLRALAAEIDREAAVAPVRTLDAGLHAVRAGTQYLASLLAVFAVFSGVLALVGVYGVIAYAIRLREREVGVRMAVGADRRSIVTLFLREGAPLLAGGLAAGLLGAIALGRALETQLFAVAPGEPRLLAAATLFFAACGGIALWWPARRAAGIEPARVLKDE